MRKINLKLKRFLNNSYSIYIGEGIFENRLQAEVSRLAPSKIAIVTDSNILKLYRDKIQKALPSAEVFSFSAGEAQKNMAVILELFSNLSSAGLDRHSLIIALGGGVTGDMTGFLSSIYLRGVPFIQVPTSLLAMVDSSIGGKTGVDTKEGKNLLGSFYQPKAVIMDTDFLKTLPEAEFTNGMAEIIKHALIKDKNYVKFLYENRESIRMLSEPFLTEMIARSCQIKAEVVQKDEKERSLRQILNFGHTIGHAIENAMNYAIPHGFAVAMGMIAEAALSVQRGILAEDDFEKIGKLIKDYGLLCFTDELKNMNEDSFFRSAKLDKKNKAGSIRVVMLKELGMVYHQGRNYSFSIENGEIKEALEKIIGVVENG
jgi:3-dehydroquinate synthase